jgi:hypothetical protein
MMTFDDHMGHGSRTHIRPTVDVHLGHAGPASLVLADTVLDPPIELGAEALCPAISASAVNSLKSRVPPMKSRRDRGCHDGGDRADAVDQQHQPHAASPPTSDGRYTAGWRSPRGGSDARRRAAAGVASRLVAGFD